MMDGWRREGEREGEKDSKERLQRGGVWSSFWEENSRWSRSMTLTACGWPSRWIVGDSTGKLGILLEWDST